MAKPAVDSTHGKSAVTLYERPGIRLIGNSKPKINKIKRQRLVLDQKSAAERLSAIEESVWFQASNPAKLDNNSL